MPKKTSCLLACLALLKMALSALSDQRELAVLPLNICHRHALSHMPCVHFTKAQCVFGGELG
jgi:hypothetical protein